jgi:hypothetical protein
VATAARSELTFRGSYNPVFGPFRYAELSLRKPNSQVDERLILQAANGAEQIESFPPPLIGQLIECFAEGDELWIELSFFLSPRHRQA